MQCSGSMIGLKKINYNVFFFFKLALAFGIGSLPFILAASDANYFASSWIILSRG